VIRPFRRVPSHSVPCHLICVFVRLGPSPFGPDRHVDGMKDGTLPPGHPSGPLYRSRVSPACRQRLDRTRAESVPVNARAVVAYLLRDHESEVDHALRLPDLLYERADSKAISNPQEVSDSAPGSALACCQRESGRRTVAMVKVPRRRATT